MKSNSTAPLIHFGFIACLVLFASSARAASGDLDPSFGVKGRQTTKMLVEAPYSQLAIPRSIVIQPDGKIVVGGSAYASVTRDAFTLVRYNTDGSHDTTFGTNGVVRIPFFPTGYEQAYSIALQPDGKIVAAGLAYLGIAPSNDANTAFAVARYNADGSFDKTFGIDGKVTTDFTATLDEAREVMVQPDGKIVVAGFITPHATNDGFYDFAVVRYNPDGSIDTSFGDGGHTFTDFNGGGDFPQGAVLQPDGKIVLAGLTSNPNSPNQHFGLARYLPNGALDPAFGSGGKVVTTFGAYSENARSIKLAPDGKLVVVGDAYFASGYNGQNDYALARYNPNGSLDTTFNGTGKLLRGAGLGGFDSDNSELGYDVVLQPDGKMIVTGQSRLFRQTNGADVDLEVFRLNTNGSLDTTFGNGGTTYTDWAEIFFLPTPPDYGTGRSADGRLGIAGALQDDGKLVVAAGIWYSRSRQDFGVARYLNDAAFAQGAPVPQSAVSRKLHGGYACDVALPLAGTAAVESRRGTGADSLSHQLVVTFAKPVTVGGVTTTSQDGATRVSQTIAGNVVTIDLTNVADAQQVTVTLANVNDGTRAGDVKIPVAFLLGDANGDHAINSADALQTRSHAGETTNEANYRFDFNLDGVINSADAAIVRNRSGRSVP